MSDQIPSEIELRSMERIASALTAENKALASEVAHLRAQLRATKLHNALEVSIDRLINRYARKHGDDSVATWRMWFEKGKLAAKEEGK